MKVGPEDVTVEVEFSHPTYLRILHHIGEDRDMAEWLKTLAWVQLARDIGRYEVSVKGDLPEDVLTNIELYQQHREENDRDTDIEDVINEFVDLSFDDLIEQNDLVDEDTEDGDP